MPGPYLRGNIINDWNFLFFCPLRNSKIKTWIIDQNQYIRLIIQNILFTKAAYQFIMKDTENAMETLREALEEDHSQFYFLKEILPGILLDKNIAAMVKYYTH